VNRIEINKLLTQLTSLARKIPLFFNRKRIRIIIWSVSFVLVLFIGLNISGRLMTVSAWREFRSELSQMKVDDDTNALSKGSSKKSKQSNPIKGVYLVIDTALNKMTLRKNEDILYEALVSCGSGNVLEDPSGKRTWVFDTPRGEFFVRYKLRDPVWIKPDWAFIEEGKDIPKSQQERIESGVLGDYALGFGDGFFIHGTLYTRLLGRNVTHGCIRVGDKDLATIYKKVPIGAPIYIF